MALKHFNEYYTQICNQYQQLQEVLQDLSNEVSNGMVEPERLEQLKKTIEPVENNYRTLGYIKYLLNKPTKKKKLNRYNGANKKLLEISKGRTQQDLVNQNNDIIQNLKI